MNKLCWKGRAFKALSYGKKCQKAGRNFSGSITIFHRGGGSKKLLRRIDFERKILGKGLIERIEYDPNRTARIALVRWFKPTDFFNRKKSFAQSLSSTRGFISFNTPVPSAPLHETEKVFSYILASDQLKIGDEVLNFYFKNATLESISNEERTNKINLNVSNAQLYQKSGNSLPLWLAPLGSVIHNIELYPGKGGALARAAGTCAQLVQKNIITPDQSIRFASNGRKACRSQCIIRLPSGKQQLIDSHCHATIGIVSNTDHRTRQLTKAGQSRWRGRRPVVRGVAMNPIDHPHGGGEGRTKGGRPSVSPWGKPAKGAKRRKKAIYGKDKDIFPQETGSKGRKK